jgi:hypothetical protein
MKKSICLAACLFALAFTPVSAQPVPAPPTPRIPAQATPAPMSQPPGNFNERLQTIINQDAASRNPAPSLTKFDLDFPGGTPTHLVKAIEKAMGKPLNTIISDEDANVQLPPLKMNHVNVAQLFQALEAAGRKAVGVYNQGYGSYSLQTTGYSFKTESGNLSDDSIWYSHVEKPTLPTVMSSQKVCRFYSLTPYLNRGFTVDDITTAIQTGWKMSGITSPPELNYHKETKLLIAFGEPDKLQTIQDVLNTLPSTRYSLPALDVQMKQLQDQVGKLQKAIPATAPPPAVAPEEKSGK